MSYAASFDVCRHRTIVGGLAAIAVVWLLSLSVAHAQTTSTWTTCAQEGGFCSFSGTRTIRYGANSSWVTREINSSGGGVECSNAAFGDPAYGIRKSCQLAEGTSTANTSWTFCSNEYELCAFSGNRPVRYGVDDDWVIREITASRGGVQCSNSVFGDPAYGIRKRCELASTGSTGTTQEPPTISGMPATSAAVGSAYSFHPTTSNPSGDTLAFSVLNVPSWATFNTTNGSLSGEPTLGDVGTYPNVTISVSNGSSTVSLPAFSIEVIQSSSGAATLSWTPPTQNTDGTSLTNLAGYRIYYGTSSTSLTQQIQIANAGMTSYVMSGLGTGTYYFGVRSYNTLGTESELSNIASKAIL
jgi:hypothetical protein